MNNYVKINLFTFTRLSTNRVDCCLTNRGNMGLQRAFYFFYIFYKYIRKNNRHLFLIYYYSIKFSGNGFFFKNKQTERRIPAPPKCEMVFPLQININCWLMNKILPFATVFNKQSDEIGMKKRIQKKYMDTFLVLFIHVIINNLENMTTYYFHLSGKQQYGKCALMVLNVYISGSSA